MFVPPFFTGEGERWEGDCRMDYGGSPVTNTNWDSRVRSVRSFMVNVGKLEDTKFPLVLSYPYPDFRLSV